MRPRLARARRARRAAARTREAFAVRDECAAWDIEVPREPSILEDLPGGAFFMHSDVLGLLDEHLAELQALRRDLTLARPIRPGERWDAAAATLRSAQRYASELTHILTDDPAGIALLTAEPAAKDEAEAPTPPAAHLS